MNLLGSPTFNFAVCRTNFHFLKNTSLYIGEKFFRSETPRGREVGVKKKMECQILFSAPLAPTTFHFALPPLNMGLPLKNFVRIKALALPQNSSIFFHSTPKEIPQCL